MVFLNLSKAFDVLNQRLILTNIEALSISFALWNWIANQQQMRFRATYVILICC